MEMEMDLNNFKTNEDADYPPLVKKRKNSNNANVFSNSQMIQSISTNVPNYLVMKKTKGDFTKDSPFFVAKTLKNIASYKNVKKIKDGLLIETNSSEDSRKLLNLKLF